jgi:hypothetical protein
MQTPFWNESLAKRFEFCFCIWVGNWLLKLQIHPWAAPAWSHMRNLKTPILFYFILFISWFASLDIG